MKYCPLLQLFSMIKSEDRIKRRGDFFWSVEDFSFEKDTIGRIFTGQYYGLHNQCLSPLTLRVGFPQEAMGIYSSQSLWLNCSGSCHFFHHVTYRHELTEIFLTINHNYFQQRQHFLFKIDNRVIKLHCFELSTII